MAIGPFCRMRRLRKALRTIPFGIASDFVLMGGFLYGASPPEPNSPIRVLFI